MKASRRNWPEQLFLLSSRVFFHKSHSSCDFPSNLFPTPDLRSLTPNKLLHITDVHKPIWLSIYDTRIYFINTNQAIHPWDEWLRWDEMRLRATAACAFIWAVGGPVLAPASLLWWTFIASLRAAARAVYGPSDKSPLRCRMFSADNQRRTCPPGQEGERLWCSGQIFITAGPSDELLLMLTRTRTPSESSQRCLGLGIENQESIILASRFSRNR